MTQGGHSPAMVDISKYVGITSGVGSNGSGGGTAGFTSELSISGVPGPASLNVAYDFTPVISGNIGLTLFELAGTLPPGLTFDFLDGSISGTPTQAGTFSGLSITVTDMWGAAVLPNLSIVVTNAPAYAPSLDFSDFRNSQYIGQVA